ncbi:hypothetical protein JOQ06_009163, partial [Pogonophryne albipinna]
METVLDLKTLSGNSSNLCHLSFEHDDCASGQDECDENAICTNTIRGHLCTCKPGYVGNGTICR